MPLGSSSWRRPASTPRAGSPGTDGVLWRMVRPDSSSMRRKSVNVPPTSTPSRSTLASRSGPGLQDAVGRGHIMAPPLDEERRLVLRLVERRDAVLREDVVVVVVRGVPVGGLHAARRLLPDDDHGLHAGRPE